MRVINFAQISVIISYGAIIKGLTISPNAVGSPNITTAAIVRSPSTQTNHVKNSKEDACYCTSVPGWAIALLVIICLLIVLALIIIIMLVITWKKLQNKSVTTSSTATYQGNHNASFRHSSKPIGDAPRSRNALPPLNYGEERKSAMKKPKRIEEDLREY